MDSDMVSLANVKFKCDTDMPATCAPWDQLLEAYVPAFTCIL